MPKATIMSFIQIPTIKNKRGSNLSIKPTSHYTTEEEKIEVK